MKLLTRKEAAAQLGVSKAWISARVKDGTLPFVRLGPKLLRFDPDDIDKYIEQQRGGACSTKEARSGGSDSNHAAGSSVSRRERQIEERLRSKLLGSGSSTTAEKPTLLVVNGQHSRKSVPPTSLGPKASA